MHDMMRFWYLQGLYEGILCGMRVEEPRERRNLNWYYMLALERSMSVIESLGLREWSMECEGRRVKGGRRGRKRRRVRISVKRNERKEKVGRYSKRRTGVFLEWRLGVQSTLPGLLCCT